MFFFSFESYLDFIFVTLLESDSLINCSSTVSPKENANCLNISQVKENDKILPLLRQYFSSGFSVNWEIGYLRNQHFSVLDFHLLDS